MQHAAGVAQAGDGGTVEQMGVDARHLRRHVGTQAEHAARQLVDQFKGAQVGILASAGHQRFQILEQRRHHQFISVQTEIIQHEAAQLFDLARFRRQNIGNIFGQKPIRHEGARYGRKLKNASCEAAAGAPGKRPNLIFYAKTRAFRDKFSE